MVEETLPSCFIFITEIKNFELEDGNYDIKLKYLKYPSENENPFERIKNGTKTVEFRSFNEI